MVNISDIDAYCNIYFVQYFEYFAKCEFLIFQILMNVLRRPTRVVKWIVPMFQGPLFVYPVKL